MRLYAVADIHARQERLRRIRDTVADLAPDVLVIAGDLCQFRQPEALLELLDARDDDVELVITGRYAHRSVLERADLVTEMRELKHYYRRGVLARTGIER